MNLWPYIRLGRPKFWTIFCVAMHGAGALIAVYDGFRFDARIFWRVQLVIWSLNAMTLYLNEYFDVEADRLNTTPTRWTGGSRVLVESDINPASALWIGVGFAIAAAVFTSVLMPYLPPGRVVPVGIVLAAMGALAWQYAAPPLRLQYHGLGEASSSAVIVGAVPLLGYVAQTSTIRPMIVAALTPLYLAHFARMLVMNLPDRHGDAAAGKRTLVVILGPDNAVRLHNTILGAAYVAALACLMARVPWTVVAAVFAPAPIALYQGRQLAQRRWLDVSRLDSITTVSTIHLNLTAFSLPIGFAIALHLST
jgi:1,4-dihydroxy-2-naphthoate octaprenyltransferase